MYVMSGQGNQSTEVVDCSSNTASAAASNDRYTCHQNRSLLGPCDGLTDVDFGYATGQPCILLKLNKVRAAAVVQSVTVK